MDVWISEADRVSIVFGVYAAVIDVHLAVDWDSGCAYVSLSG